MGLVTRFRAAASAFRGVEKGQLEAWSSIWAAGIDQLLGGTSLTRPYAQHPTIYAAVSAIATNIAALELEMFPDSDEKRERPVKKSVVKALIEDPNEEMHGGQLIEATMQHLELVGNAFWYLSGVARTGAGGPRFPTRIDLWIPEQVKPVKKNGRLTAWEYRSSDENFSAPLDRVLHFKYPNPHDPIMGLGPLASAMVVAGGDHKSHIWNESFFENAAIPFGLLSPEPGQIVHEDSLIRLRDQLEARHRGSRKHGRLGATKAALRFLEIGISQKDMDFALLMDKATEKILMVWKVPPAFAGVQKDANYSAIVQQGKQFWQNHLPKAKYLERMIRRKLCTAFGIAEMPYFKTESIRAMVEDQAVIADMARSMFNMGVPFSLINDRLELGYDADTNPSMSIPWIPFSMVNADEQAMAPGFDEPMGGPDRNPRPGEDQNQPGDEPTQDEGDVRRRRPRLVRSTLSREVLREMNWKTLINRIRDEEHAMERRVRDHQYNLRIEVLRNLKNAAKGMKQDDEPAQFDIESVLFDKEKAAADITRRTEPVYKSALEKGVRTVVEELQLDVDFSLLTPEVENFLMEKQFQIADLVDRPAIDRLRATLQEGMRNGENLEKIADRVEEVFAVERSRARRIARTEMAESFNGGRYESMKAAAVKKIEWLTARDTRVRDEHVPMDGEVILLGDLFSNGLRYPLDPSGPPEQIVNCRCVPLPAA